MIKNTHDFVPIEGKLVNLREIEVSDAKFILDLRLSSKGIKFLNKTNSNIDNQIQYIKNYKTLEYEWYFIVESKDHVPLGCLSAYDVKNNSVCTGRWIMTATTSTGAGIEGDLLLKNFVFNILDVDILRTDTRYSNKNMINYFRMWGCEITSKTDELIYFSLVKKIYEKNKYKIERFCR